MVRSNLDPTVTGTARVAYHVTVHGQERTFTADTTVSGSAAQAALSLIQATRHDARDWLYAEMAKAPNALVKGLFGRVKALSKRVESGRILVAAVVEVDGVTHEYSGAVGTDGDPYRAAGAALVAAEKDLWDWAWDHKKA